MRFRRLIHLIATLAVALIFTAFAPGCDRSSPPPKPTVPAAAPTVASLVPAATDLLMGMGAGGHLVAVSNYDQPREETKSLPRVGDYRTVDWEKIAELRPAVMVVQFRPDKMPAGLVERATSYGVRVVNVKIVRLDDVFATLAQLGDAVGEKAKADRAAVSLRTELNAVRARVAGRPIVRTYVGRTENPLEAVGGGNYVDDLLAIAGGQNVLAGPGYAENSFPTIDRELLRQANPDAAINLLPAASPQVVAGAKQFWATVPEVSAANAGRVHYLTDQDVLWPGLNVGRVAERFAAALHPEAATRPAPAATRPAADGLRSPLPLVPEGERVRVRGRVSGVVESRKTPLEESIEEGTRFDVPPLTPSLSPLGTRGRGGRRVAGESDTASARVPS